MFCLGYRSTAKNTYQDGFISTTTQKKTTFTFRTTTWKVNEVKRLIISLFAQVVESHLSIFSYFANKFFGYLFFIMNAIDSMQHIIYYCSKSNHHCGVQQIQRLIFLTKNLFFDLFLPRNTIQTILNRLTTSKCYRII